MASLIRLLLDRGAKFCPFFSVTVELTRCFSLNLHFRLIRNFRLRYPTKYPKRPLPVRSLQSMLQFTPLLL